MKPGHTLRCFFGFTCWLLTFAAMADTAKPVGRQSFETCSIVTGEYLTVLQLNQQGFAQKDLEVNLPGISAQGKSRIEALYRMVAQEGLADTYSRINSEYAQCAKRVYQASGMPKIGSREHRFYFCAGENKVRYEILLAVILGGSKNEVLPQLSADRRPVAITIFDLFSKEGDLGIYDTLATELKACLNDIG